VKATGLSERYRKIVIKWKSLKVVTMALLLVFSSVLIGSVFIEYLSAHGLEDQSWSLGLGTVTLPVRIALLPFAGIALLFVFGWIYLIQETAYVRATPGSALEEKLMSVRMVKHAAYVVAIFASCLFIPYLLGSLMFLRFLASMTSLAHFLEPHSLQAVTAMSSFNALRESWKYVISLNLAAAIAATSILIIARRGRKIPTTKPR
jgi:hypothetical protein